MLSTAITRRPVRLAVASIAGLGLAGGVALAADAATGTVKWLEEHKIGWDVRVETTLALPGYDGLLGLTYAKALTSGG